MFDYKGTGVALLTPFEENFKIDFSGLKKLIDYTSSQGADYLVVHGTTGEPSTTSLSEKKEILEFVKNQNSKKLPIVVGLGGNNTEEVIQNFSEYNFSGVSAILSVGPYYNKPSQEGYYRHFSAIAEKSPVPVIVYNVPGRTGSSISASTISKLAQHGNIKAIKEASGDMVQCMEIMAKKPSDFQLIAGDDLLTLPMMSIGGVGSISVLGNIIPKLYSEMINLGLQNKFSEASKLLFKMLELNPLLYVEGNPVGAKKALSCLQICKNIVRLPLAETSPELGEKIETAIYNLGIKL